MKKRFFLIFALFSLPFVGCATFGANTTENVTYLDGAQNNYTAGERAFADARFDEAISYFEHVRSKFPFSKYTAQSDLRIADAYFKKENYEEAAMAYDFFLKFHPRHELVPHALFNMAKSYYEMMPSDFFLFPPSYVKDQSPTQEALSVCNRFLREFPEDQNAEQARKLRDELRLQLAKHDMYVAKFYAKRQKWPAAFSRYEEVASDYSDLDLAANALYECARILRDHMNAPDQAQALFEQIVDRYKESEFAKVAQDALEKSKENRPL